MENSIWNIPIDECPIDEFLFVCLIFPPKSYLIFFLFSFSNDYVVTGDF